MTRVSTKSIEKRQIENFLLCNHTGLKFINLEADETPDFIATTVDRLIGIEHTRFIDSNNRKIEQHRQDVLNKARERFEREVGVDLECWFRYSDIPMGKENTKQFYIDLLFELVNEIYQTNKARSFRVSTKRYEVENDYFDSISVSSDTSWSNWQSVGAFLVRPVNYYEVQEYIDRKSLLINQYPNEIQEKWLVIVAGLGNRSSGFRFDLLDKGNLSRKQFDKVFFFMIEPEKLSKYESIGI